MGIFSRMTDIINSNINAMLDQAEDPEKMIRLIIQEMEDTLVEVRSSSAGYWRTAKAPPAGWNRCNWRPTAGRTRPGLPSARSGGPGPGGVAGKARDREEIAVVEGELKATDEHIAQLNGEIAQLQQKLGDAKAKQKALLMRSKTVESRIKVKRQIHREALDTAFQRFEHFERRMDNLESQLESMDLGRRWRRTWRRK